MIDARIDEMVNMQIIGRGINDPKLIHAMKKVKRELFVPDKMKKYAYDDMALPIGYSQTISQPFIVALMTEAAKVNKDSRVLEIGTGSGYQAAILGELCKEVDTIEIVKPLALKSKSTLQELGYSNVLVKCEDGYKGWPEKVPFDAIIVTAAPDKIPYELIMQLKEGGRMIIPVGIFDQELLRITRTKNGMQEEKLLPVTFVPMVEKENS